MKKDFSNHREDFFQFVWHHQLYRINSWKTTKGKHLDVVFPGYPNRYSGPDFLNARIRIDDLLWIGHVEIHVKSSEWVHHGHHTDPAYDNVILHVVHKDNKEVLNSKGQTIPTITTEGVINTKINSGWQSWLKQKDLPCASRLLEIPLIERKLWLEALYTDRLERKTKDVASMFLSVDGQVSELIYLLTAKYFGGHLNSAPMLRLARIIPHQWAEGVAPNDLAAILLGASGWITERPDDYIETLFEGYMDFSRVAHHRMMSKQEWRWSHMYIGGSPVIRIVQFAGIIDTDVFKEEYVLEASLDKIMEDLNGVRIPEYWSTHHLPGAMVSRKLGGPGIGLIERWMINVLVPICKMKAEKLNDRRLVDRIEETLVKCGPESNAITQQWVAHGWDPENALESQGMIELTKSMCTHRKCLNCRIGQKILMSDD